MIGAASRVLLRRGIGRADIDALAGARRWALLNVFAQREGRPRQVVFGEPSGEAFVTFVDDYRIDARYLVIAGHDPETVVAQLRAQIACVTLEEVVAMLDDPSERARAICWLGVVSPSEPPPEVVAAIRDAWTSERANERDAARFAAEACAIDTGSWDDG